MEFILNLFAIFLVIMVSETLYRTKAISHESSRKLIHIVVGILISFWPLWLTFSGIRVIGILMLIVVLISRRFRIFKSVHTKERFTLGEAYYALAIILLTYLTDNKWVFFVSIMQMSLSDGLAAVIGRKYGKNNTYKIFGQIKSRAGSMTFFVVAFVIVSLYPSLVNIQYNITEVITYCAILTLVENVAVFGLDDIMIPVVSVVLLRSLH